jgi:8-oxo-dGTP pyrophosphatase MutT (NUDIX family)
MSDIGCEHLDMLAAIRDQLDHGDNATQTLLDGIVDRWKPLRHILRPGEKDEDLELVGDDGSPLDLRAPRWLCHLLGLRHKCAHVLIRWTTPGLGRVLILQVRSWSKSDSPGQIDISVGGHVVGKSGSEQTACGEMEEELGIGLGDLLNGRLSRLAGYPSELEEQPSKNFYNAEWRDVFMADLIPSHFDNIRFNDKEAVGLYLCPEPEAQNLREKGRLPIASALRQYLERRFRLPLTDLPEPLRTAHGEELC